MQNLEDQQLLQHLAYLAWLDRGQPQGSPEVDWLRAEQQLQQQQAAAVQTGIAQAETQTIERQQDISSTQSHVADFIPTINDAIAAPKSRRSNIRIKAAEVPMEVPPSPTTPPDQPPTKAKSKRSTTKVASPKSQSSYDSQSDASRL